MVKALAPGYKLSEGTLANLDEIWQVYEDAFEEDDIWKAAMKGCKKEDIHSWVISNFAPRPNLPDITTYKITEESTGYDQL